MLNAAAIQDSFEPTVDLDDLLYSLEQFLPLPLWKMVVFLETVNLVFAFPCTGPKLTKKILVSRLFQWPSESCGGRNSMNNNGDRQSHSDSREFSLLAQKFCFITVLSLAINCLGTPFASTSFKPFWPPSNPSTGPPLIGVLRFPRTFQEAPVAVLSTSFQDQMMKSKSTLVEGSDNTGQNKAQSKHCHKFST